MSNARQPLQNHPSGHLGGWATSCSAEEMLDGQHQSVDTLAHDRTAHKGPCRKHWKRISGAMLLMSPGVDDPIGPGTELNWSQGGLLSGVPLYLTAFVTLPISRRFGFLAVNERYVVGNPGRRSQGPAVLRSTAINKILFSIP